MATFVASKFDPETSSDRPKLGEVFEANDKKWEIKRVDWIEAGELHKSGFKEPDPAPNDHVMLRQHASRPMVFWIVFVDEVKEEKTEE